MDFVVLNGSPKSKYSVTLQYVKYIEKKFPQHNFIKHHVGKKIKSIMKKEGSFESIIDDIDKADGLIWCTPVYTCAVPYQLMRFTDRVFEEELHEAFEGMHSTSITTSAHFYDHTAHNYLKGISEDLGMNYLDGFSAEMYDLLEKEERRNLLKLAKRFFYYIKKDVDTKREFMPIDYDMKTYEPQDIDPVRSSSDYQILVVSDATEEDQNLKNMIDVFKKTCKYDVEVQNLHDIEIKGGCRGCVKCAQSGECVYNDDHEEFYNKKFQPADGIVFATKLENRFASSRWKLFYDRGFYNGHRPIQKGKQLGYIVSGPLKQDANMKQILKGEAEVGMMNLVGFVTDEPDNSERITEQIQQLSEDFAWGLENDFIRPFTFLHEGGHKVFRDLVYQMKFIFTQDHKFYKKHGLYDFPQKQYKQRIQNFFLRILFAMPGIREKVKEKTLEYMVKPLKEVVEES